MIHDDIEHMTANEIAKEKQRLRELVRKGEITPAQAGRLASLDDASRRIDGATRRRNWRLW